MRSANDLKPYLPARWREHLEIYGSRRKLGMSYEPYPKSAPRACRRDAWPDDGGVPGSNLDLIRSQYLDAYGIEYGILGPLGLSGQSELNGDFSAALTSAVNDWQRDAFTRPEPRLQVGHRDADGEHGSRGGGDRALRRRSGLRAGVHADAHGRAPRQPPLLADLRRGRAARLARRPARVRLGRPCLYRNGLALLLRRGGRGALDLVPDGGDEPRHRGRVRALPAPEGRHDRGRLRLAAGARPGASTSCSSACAARCRT